MEKIGNQKIWSYFDEQESAHEAQNPEIRGGSGHEVRSYFELAKKVAELQFLNREHVLLFRGQSQDYRTTQKNSMLKATIFRLEGGRRPNELVLEKRFEKLRSAERELAIRCEAEELQGHHRVIRYRIIRWAILQHYEVCATPLLDVTHSLRIAASFASNGNDTDDAFVFAFGVPNLSGAVTASSEAGLQIVRLSSACPPDAVRPHIQEGYLLGEYPEMVDYQQKSLYDDYEMDFGRRLIAKFRFNPSIFWNNKNYPRASEAALYPAEHRDPLLQIANEIRNSINKDTA